ncbi:MAG: DUF2267 domain-containing protein [Alphaproteobacteria bacterium]|nr:DUF2267 domain-containing protein [Alphaproteobacteria bacterium]
MSKITLLNKNIQKTFIWLKDIEDNMEWLYEDKSTALALLRAVLCALREHLPLNNLAHFSAQLPVVIRGLLFQDWNPEHVAFKERKAEDFLASVKAHLPESAQALDMEKVVMAVFTTIAGEIDLGEINKLKKILPKPLLNFFPDVTDRGEFSFN